MNKEEINVQLAEELVEQTRQERKLFRCPADNHKYGWPLSSKGYVRHISSK